MMKAFETRLAGPEIRTLLDAVERWSEAAALPEKAHFRLMLVLEELATNAMKHGYHGRADGEIDVGIVDDGEGIVVTLRDAGDEFDPFSAAPAPDIDEPVQTRRMGGLGVHFVKSVAQSCSYRRAGGRNEIVVRLARGD
jgi:anti-sigma regulatory factor (Ser/Thr protein kinase)